jgi:hypothetical protein
MDMNELFARTPVHSNYRIFLRLIKTAKKYQVQGLHPPDLYRRYIFTHHLTKVTTRL